MICTHYQNGQKLDVAGLNVVTVLVDRSQTQLTEIGWNSWRKGLEGPPHSHDAKEQIFYVTDGVGVVVVGKERYPVKPGSLVYVPAAVVHQTIVQGDAPLSYFLFNAFLDSSKEGHASFADHIEKVKQVRFNQAQAQVAAVAGADGHGGSSQPGKCVQDVPHLASAPGSNIATLVLDPEETRRCSVTLLKCPEGDRSAMAAHKDKEQTFFVLSGRGQVVIGSETASVNAGDVVFVPSSKAYSTIASEVGMAYLSFNTFIS